VTARTSVIPAKARIHRSAEQTAYNLKSMAETEYHRGHFSLPAAERVNCRCVVLSVVNEGILPAIENRASGTTRRRLESDPKKVLLPPVD
jgi:hypothetical protein